jgi:hypothetical protein
MVGEHFESRVSGKMGKEKRNRGDGPREGRKERRTFTQPVLAAEERLCDLDSFDHGEDRFEAIQVVW